MWLYELAYAAFGRGKTPETQPATPDTSAHAYVQFRLNWHRGTVKFVDAHVMSDRYVTVIHSGDFYALVHEATGKDFNEARRHALDYMARTFPGMAVR